MINITDGNSFDFIKVFFFINDKYNAFNTTINFLHFIIIIVLSSLS